MQVFHIGALIEPLSLDKLLIFADKGILFEQSIPHHYSFSEHGGENSTCDSSLLKEPRTIALDFIQQKLHKGILNVACKVLFDVVIDQILDKQTSISKPSIILVKQPISLNKEEISTIRKDNLIVLDAGTIIEVIVQNYLLLIITIIMIIIIRLHEINVR